MELSAFKTENAPAMFAETTNAKDLAPSAIERAVQENSVQEKDSVSSPMESSNQNALRIVTVASENSAVTMSASQNHSFVGQFVVTLALLTTTATLVNSVIEKESVSSQ